MDPVNPESSATERAAAALADPAPAAPADPSTELAAELAKAGVNKDNVGQAVQYLRMLQTPEGQATIVNQYLASDRGKADRERFAMDELARLASTRPEALVEIGLKNGARLPNQEEEDVPLEKTIERLLKAQEDRLNARLNQVEQGSRATAQTVAQALTDGERQREFLQWASTPQVAQANLRTEQYRAVNDRARELINLYPDRYQGAGSYSRAAQDAYSRIQSESSAFQPPKGPRSIRSTGGGVAGQAQPTTPFDFEANQNISDRDLKGHLGKAIGLAAEDFAALWTGREEY